jgi:predicted regulator of Ras-like GTPase activity (Roadblock/LC7/MglB family)
VNLLRKKIDTMLDDVQSKEQQENTEASTISNAGQTEVLSTPSLKNHSTQQKKENEMQLDEVLKPLQEVDGYLASAIFDMSGEVLVKHNNSKYNVEAIGANAVAMINAALKAVHAAGLGKCNFIQVNSDLGIFGAVWAVEDKSVVSVLLEAKANVGLAKMALAKVGENAKNKLS